MEKLAQPQFPIHELLKRRWSPLAFSDRSIASETLCQLLEAARWSASSYNEQPWSFLVATKDNPEEFNKLLGCLAEGNQVWAKDAPVLMVSIAKLNFEKTGVVNRHAFHDVGAAVCSLAIEAVDLGLLIHQMAGFDVEKVRSLYTIPNGYDPVEAIAIGYPGDPAQLPEKYYERELSPRSRKSIDQFAFTGRWGNVAPVVTGPAMV
jgi:nitroreductase